jgi:hypothetical protein
MQSTTQNLTPAGQIPGVGSSGWFASFLAVLTTPSCWLQNHPFCPEWDVELNRLMRTERFVNADKYTAEIGGHEVWVANHPYASFTLRRHEVRPSRATILRAKRKLIADVLQANMEGSHGRSGPLAVATGSKGRGIGP